MRRPSLRVRTETRCDAAQRQDPPGHMSPSVAILGATGLVGRTMLALLEQRGFPVDEPVLLASERSDARTLPFRGRALPVRPVAAGEFRDIRIALFASANAVSQQWAGPARE